ncbi:hypothetical protein ACLOJK_011629 [Asimina triloba]
MASSPFSLAVETHHAHVSSAQASSFAPAHAPPQSSTHLQPIPSHHPSNPPPISISSIQQQRSKELGRTHPAPSNEHGTIQMMVGNQWPTPTIDPALPHLQSTSIAVHAKHHLVFSVHAHEPPSASRSIQAAPCDPTMASAHPHDPASVVHHQDPSPHFLQQIC